MEFLEFFVLFAIGFAFGYCLFLYYFHKSEISMLLTILKEDINNLQVTVHRYIEAKNL